MEITGKYLLNQAESILKDRKQDARALKSKEEKENDTTVSRKGDDFNQGVLETRLLNLQESLRLTQNDYSREQARSVYLTSYPEQINENVLYEGEPLFPELKKGNGMAADLKDQVTRRLETLMHSLKSIQVEMENVLALNFDSFSAEQIDSGSLTDSSALKGLDPGRVARLTRGS